MRCCRLCDRRYLPATLKIPAARGGGGGARSALNARGRGFGPAPARLFGRPGGPKAPRAAKRRRPPGPLGFLPAKGLGERTREQRRMKKSGRKATFFLQGKGGYLALPR